MTTPATSRTGPLIGTDREAGPARSGGDETKPSWKTTELFVYLAAVIAVLIASQVVGDGPATRMTTSPRTRRGGISRC